LVVSFLQMHPYYKISEHRERYALCDLLLDFLAFYGRDFNYYSTTISVLNGGKYCSKKPKWEDSEKPFLLSVIDPLDPANDVCRGSFAAPQVRSYFFLGYLRLATSIYDPATQSILQRLMDAGELLRHNIISPNRRRTRVDQPLISFVECNAALISMKLQRVLEMREIEEKVANVAAETPQSIDRNPGWHSSTTASFKSRGWDSEGESCSTVPKFKSPKISAGCRIEQKKPSPTRTPLRDITQNACQKAFH
jgi:DNA polymerase sigma